MSRSKQNWLYWILASVFLMGFLAGDARAETKIGIITFTEEGRYTNSQQGILDQLKQDGYAEPAVNILVENAKGNKTKAAELVQRFTDAKLDLIMTIGTAATVSVTRKIKDVPVVFSMVYDPIEAGVSQDWKSSGNNTTGASTKLPMEMLVSTLKGFAPVKRLAVLYTPGEKNSELQLLELQKTEGSTKVKIVPVILGKKEEVADILPGVLPTVEAIYLTGSSIVGATVPVIAELAGRSKVVTFTHLDDLVYKGALIGVCTNSYQGGRLAGRKAVKILKGAKPSSIPIEVEKKVDIILNKKTATAGKFSVPASFMSTVTTVID